MVNLYCCNSIDEFCVKLKDINVNETINKVRTLIKKEKELPLALIVAIETLLMVLELLCNRFKLNSSNSSKPPSSDLNRKKKQRVCITDYSRYRSAAKGNRN